MQIRNGFYVQSWEQVSLYGGPVHRECDFYIAPQRNEWANALDFLYGFDGTKAQAEVFAAHVDGKVVDSDWVEWKQEAMHLAEGCSSSNCRASEDYVADEIGGCNLNIEKASDFADLIQVVFSR